MPSLNIHSTSLHYEVAGDGPPLLFIHGLGSSVEDWEPQVREFAKHFRVIACDLRGHGRSDKPPGPYSVPQFAADTAALLKALGAGGAHVVGLSLGGCIAFQLALDFPALVQTLTIVNSAPEFVRRSFKTKLEIWRRTALVRWRGLRPMGERIGRRLLPRPEHAALRAAFIERFVRNDPRAYLETLKSLVGWSVADQLGSLRCPVLIVAAEHDYTPVAAQEKCARRIPGARLVVIPDARHATPTERPAEFNAVLAAFLAAHSAGIRHFA